MKITEFTIKGRACKAAPPAFSEDVCDALELFENAQAIAKANEGKPDGEKVAGEGGAKLARLIRKIAKECLTRGGHTAEEAEEILLSYDASDDQETGIPALVRAIGLL